MEVIPRGRGRGRSSGSLGQLRALFSGLRLAGNFANRWRNTPQPQNPPGTGRRFRGRGRGRARGRGRGNVAYNPSVRPAVSSGVVFSQNASRVLHLEQSEVWETVPTGAGKFAFSPLTVKLPALKRVAQGYGRYRVNWITIEYEPAVGTTEAGLIHWGIRAGPAPDKATEQLAKACYPRASGPIWKRSAVHAKHDLLQISPWLYIGDTAFTVVSYTNYAGEPGFFEMKYSISLDLPQ
uniref:Capsid protein n=1 Tax=Suncus murinus ribovirus 3 TaxID=3139577 RepID=A0AB38ZKH3_9VIRU